MVHRHFVAGGVLSALLLATAVSAHPPAFPQNPRGRVKVTCQKKEPRAPIEFQQWAFETGGATATQINFVGDERYDGIFGRAGSRYLPYVEGPLQGVVQMWFELSPARGSLAMAIKKDAVMTETFHARFQLETPRGGQEYLYTCCLGALGPVAEGDKVECRALETAVVGYIQAVTTDAGLSAAEKTAKITRIMSLNSAW